MSFDFESEEIELGLPKNAGFKFDPAALNDEQLKPVTDTEGAVMVTAGAGSGKTRLLTHRIAYIVQERNVPCYNILAITFTNKAAKEMKERLQHMVANPESLWVSTFHSMCVSILRRYIDLLGYSKSFSIYDESERKKVIKAIAEDIDKDNESLPEKIGRALAVIKNEGMDLDEYAAIHKFLPKIDDIEAGCRRYQETLKSSNAVDFDDLLVLCHSVLGQFSQAREYYQNRFKYIHVDEFQDTNIIQYKIVKILAGKHKNLFVVGDEDQSIYGWRGANIGNIRDFIRDFDCKDKVYKLEQNYRSTKSILGIANEVIKNNSSRIDKRLWTSNGDGDKPVVFGANADSEEADFIMQSLKGLKAKGIPYNNTAVLMRVNSLSRSIEQKFMFYGIPYRIFGGFKFYERKEVKDALAYLKILANPRDNEAMARVLAFPKKGIGEASADKLFELSANTGFSAADIILSILDKNKDSGESTVKADMPSALKTKLQPFAAKLELLFTYRDMSISALLKYIYKSFEFDSAFAQDTEENESRKLNLRELYNSVLQTEKNNPNLSLEEYVQQIMLYSDMDAENNSDSVTIATIHSAKGLEFDNVFIVGLEEGLFPISRAMDKEDDMEEERRLMYVAVTRARKKLYLSYVRNRFMYGKYVSSPASRFLKETGLYFPDNSSDGYGLNGLRRMDDYGGARNDFNESGRYSGNYGGNKSIVPKSGFGGGICSGTKSGFTPFKTADKLKSSLDINALKVGVKVKHKRLGRV